MKLSMPLSTALLVPLLVGALGTMWCGAVWLVGTLGGWRDLARAFPASESAREDAIRFSGASLMLGRGLVPLGSYRNAVTVTIEPSGLGFRTMFLFRFGHPAIKVPWSAVKGYQNGSTLGRRWIRMNIANGEEIRIYGRAAGALDQALAAAGTPVIR